MLVERIESLTDDRLAPYRELKNSNRTRDAGLFVAEGRWLAQRLLASPYVIESVLVEERRIDDIAPLMRPDVPLWVIPDRLAPEVVGFNFHRGVLACGRRPTRADWRALPLEPPQVTLVVCVGVQDPENLGGIFRNCAAFGVDGVLLGPGCADPLSRRVLRVSMGNVLWTRFAHADEPLEALEGLRREGVRLVATVLDESARSLRGYRRPPKAALLLGEEGFGLPRDWTQLCDERLTIPMRNGVDSLNVAVASGVFLFALTSGD